MLSGLSSSRAQDVTVLSGSTVTLGCHPPTSSYTGYFEWRFYSSTGGDQIYSQPPFQLNEDEYPASRYRQVDDYGLEMSAVQWRDGGVYGCHFLTGDVLTFSTVVVIGD